MCCGEEREQPGEEEEERERAERNRKSCGSSVRSISGAGGGWGVESSMVLAAVGAGRCEG